MPRSIQPPPAPDVYLLFTTRVVRLFAYGSLSLVLVLYLAEVGLSDGRIGLLLSMTLLGDTALSLWLTTRADRVARLSPAAEATAAPSATTPPRRFLGLHRSRGVVLRLSALFALDAFAGGFVLQSVMAFWFHVNFGADPATLGGIFFAANLLAGV